MAIMYSVVQEDFELDDPGLIQSHQILETNPWLEFLVGLEIYYRIY